MDHEVDAARMPTYIDESGDTGRVADGGKPYFRLAAVWVPDDEVVRSFQDSVVGLRRRLGLPTSFEFKFSKTTSPALRSAFFDLALGKDFRVAVTQIDKVTEPWRGATGEEQYWSCATDLAIALKRLYVQREESQARPLRERVVVDRNDDRHFLRVVKAQFRSLKSTRHEGIPLVGDVGFRDSRPEPWLQLVDMVCGATGSWIDGDDPIWHERLEPRRIDELSRL